MTAHVREWLPIEVATRAKVRDAIDGAVRDWSEDWFAGQRLEATRFRPIADGSRPRAEGLGWRVFRGPVAMSASAHSTQRLVSWALDAPLSRLELTPGDAAVIEALEHAVFDDLIARVEALLGLPDQSRPQPSLVDRPFDGAEGIEVAVTDATGAPLLSLALPFAALLPLCRASLPPRARSEGELADILSALATTEVALEATLGHAEIGVVDLRKLACGDVLVLDRELEAGVCFDLPGSDHPFALARLGEDAGQMTLTLQSEQD